MSISLLQWNIWYKEDVRAVAEFLKSQPADIITLQELTFDSPDQSVSDSAAHIAAALGYESFVKKITLEGTDGVTRYIGNGIFSRFPITSSRVVMVNEPAFPGGGYSQEPRAYVEATIDTSLGQITFGTLHSSYTDRFAETPQKATETRHIIEAIAPHHDRFVFTGDLNATPQHATIKAIESRLKHLGPALTEPTWTTKPFSYLSFDATTLDWRLDYAFGTSDIQVHSAEIIQTKLSDHLPIRIEFSVATSTA